MKTILFTLLMMSAALLFGLDTDTAKFFRREAGPETVELPADQIYPQGRLFPFTFYSTGGGSMKKRGELLPEAEREADTAQIVKAGVTMIGPQYELNDRAVATARKYGVKVVYTVHPVIDGKELDRLFARLEELIRKNELESLPEMSAACYSLLLELAGQSVILQRTPELQRALDYMHSHLPNRWRWMNWCIIPG